MSDIVQRLRNSLLKGDDPAFYMLRNADVAEAAGEIERLQEEVAQAKRYETCLHENLVAHELANERLRAALRELIGEYEIYQGNVAAVTWARARAALEGEP